ncbi:MAG: imidazolonepropionase [Alphaproteobacteria bacterium]|nr:imidazolonepropionase [Alphaproteobacteria bacterium]
MWDTLWLDANVATMIAGGAPYGAIRNGGVAVKEGAIAWVGPREDLQGDPGALAAEVRYVDGQWITPGLIDCHTHLVFAGNRAREFEMRLNGASYEEIARAGGGILSTVKATRGASVEALIDASAPRLKALMRQGVTTVEIKSGYGLDLETERRMLRAARALEKIARLDELGEHGVRIRTTFLGLHAVPPDYKERRGDYVALVCDEMLPALAREGLVDAVDAFCETIGFTPEETERFFIKAQALGIPIKLHAEQLSDQGGGALAARFKALSADHLEHLSDAGVAAMAAVGTVAVLLPGAFYALREEKPPPVEALRAAGVAIALATDCNPGTSPLASPLMAMNLACTLFRLTPEEALAGMTRNAARALGLEGEIGTLEAGKAADLAFWRIDEPAELAYWMGADLLEDRAFAGRTAWTS